jgi:alpha-glucoside transport system substrate-binding protein
MKKRMIILLVVLLTAALPLMAGGGKEEAEPMEGDEGQIGGSLSVIATWGGQEEEVFKSMIEPFTEETGIQVNFTGTRDMDAILSTRVDAGNPPDVAVFANPGKLAEFVQQGEMVELDQILDMDMIRDEYSQSWVDLGTIDGQYVGLFTKTAAKGFIWYDPETQEMYDVQIPESWDQLLELSRNIMNNTEMAPWVVALESGAASGWPGTDWLENIFIKMHGPELYNQWHQGELAWTSDEVRSVWEAWGKIVGNTDMMYGGSQYALTTNFNQAHVPVYKEDPSAVFTFQATFLKGFITDQYPNLEPETGFNVFRFPSINDEYAASVVIAGDVVGLFNDTPQSRAFIKYLATAEAQGYWLETGAISPNTEVALEEYTDPIIREAARTMQESEIVVFDASDLMPSELNQTFFSGVMDYVQNPGSLDSILQELERVRQEAY